jgi:hypothetical protein
MSIVIAPAQDTMSMTIVPLPDARSAARLFWSRRGTRHDRRLTTPVGQDRITVPPGTGRALSCALPARACHTTEATGRGSPNIHIAVDNPRQLSARQRLLYEQLRARRAPCYRPEPAWHASQA